MPPETPSKFFRAALITPEMAVTETDVTSVVFPAHDGMVGILTHRAPLLTKLGTGVLRLETPAGPQVYVISGGYAQMKDNVLTILTDEATAAAQITPAIMEAEAAKAQDATLDPARRTAAARRLAAMRQLAGTH